MGRRRASSPRTSPVPGNNTRSYPARAATANASARAVEIRSKKGSSRLRHPQTPILLCPEGLARDQDIKIDAWITTSLAFAVKQRTLLVGTPGTGRTLGFKLPRGSPFNHMVNTIKLRHRSHHPLCEQASATEARSRAHPLGQAIATVSAPGKDTPRTNRLGTKGLHTRIPGSTIGSGGHGRSRQRKVR